MEHQRQQGRPYHCPKTPNYQKTGFSQSPNRIGGSRFSWSPSELRLLAGVTSSASNPLEWTTAAISSAVPPTNVESKSISVARHQLRSAGQARLGLWVLWPRPSSNHGGLASSAMVPRKTHYLRSPLATLSVSPRPVGMLPVPGSKPPQPTQTAWKISWRSPVCPPSTSASASNCPWSGSALLGRV